MHLSVHMIWIQYLPPGLSTVELLAQGFQFFLAGFNNTAGVLTVFLHTLASHPEIQEKAQREVDQVFSGKVGVN